MVKQGHVTPTLPQATGAGPGALSGRVTSTGRPSCNPPSRRALPSPSCILPVSIPKSPPRRAEVLGCLLLEKGLAGSGSFSLSGAGGHVGSPAQEMTLRQPAGGGARPSALKSPRRARAPPYPRARGDPHHYHLAPAAAPHPSAPGKPPDRRPCSLRFQSPQLPHPPGGTRELAARCPVTLAVTEGFRCGSPRLPRTVRGR